MTTITQASQGIAWAVTEAKILMAIERLVAAADPVKIIAFGSRAKGSAREDSDVDLAVILSGESCPATSLWRAVSGIHLPVDLLTTNESAHNRLRGSINSVHHDIAEQGVILYEKGAHGSPDRSAVAKICRGRADAAA